MEGNHLCNFGRVHYEEHLCDFVFQLGLVVKEKMMIKVSVVFAISKHWWPFFFSTE